jgi:hypothetical protein
MPEKTTRPTEHGGAAGYWLGVYYPAGYTIAVIDDIEEAERCAKDLVESGIPAPTSR